MDEGWYDRGGAGQYKKVQILKPPKTADSLTPEQRYWKQFKPVTTNQAYSAVYCVAFCRSAPYDFAATNSTRIQIYNKRGKNVKRTISRFKDVVYCASFRSDGKLVVGSGEETDIKVFDLASRDLLRLMKGHKRAVHTCKFVDDRVHVISGADDNLIKYWDVPSGEAVMTMEGHTDYVRSLFPSPSAPEIWLSGSYDHTVRLWDTRTGSSVMTMQHGQPVQATLILPGGGIAISAGNGGFMKVWDILSGGRLLTTVHNHQKPVTCLAVDGDGGRVLSGSLDHHLKVYDVQEYKVRHTTDYAQPILAMDISPDKGTIAVGMSDGLLDIRARPAKGAEGDGLATDQESTRKRRGIRAGTFQYFIRGQDEGPAEDDFKVEKEHKQRLQPYDKMLRSFRYGAALDAALTKKEPLIVCGVLRELSLRDGLTAALGGRDAAGLAPLLQFLCRFVTDQRLTSQLVDVAQALLRIYAGAVGQSAEVDQLLVKLRWRVHEQIRFDAELLKLQGSLELLMASAMPAPDDDTE